MNRGLSAVVALVLWCAAQAAAAVPSLQQRIAAKLAEAGPGTRFGLVVAAEDGRELIAIDPDARFMPASNTKIFTTAAAFDALPALDAPDAAGGASIRLEASGKAAPDVVLRGFGDARLSSAPNCITNCLTTLADAVAQRTRRVRHVVGDDSALPDERWSSGMSWNNMQTRSGTAISALTLDDNELWLRVHPAAAGRTARAEVTSYLQVDNRILTVAAAAAGATVDRLPGRAQLRLTGSISAGAPPELIRLGIDDPAHYAAWRLRELLRARGVQVGGDIMVRHRPRQPWDDPVVRRGAPPRPPRPGWLARVVPPPLSEDLKTINKTSQNLHAELLLRRIGLVTGTGSVADGLAAINSMLARAGVPRDAYSLSDGSGMSTYNRVTPRATTTLLRWIAAQPWSAAWRATLPVAGVDGTLARRFRGTALEGRLFAKTGTLNATSALAGYMLTRSGRTLTFAVYANDLPEGTSATPVMDAALALIAAEY